MIRIKGKPGCDCCCDCDSDYEGDILSRRAEEYYADDHQKRSKINHDPLEFEALARKW